MLFQVSRIVFIVNMKFVRTCQLKRYADIVRPPPFLETDPKRQKKIDKMIEIRLEVVSKIHFFACWAFWKVLSLLS